MKNNSSDDANLFCQLGSTFVAKSNVRVVWNLHIQGAGMRTSQKHTEQSYFPMGKVGYELQC
jgi:hypothetical protein